MTPNTRDGVELLRLRLHRLKKIQSFFGLKKTKKNKLSYLFFLLWIQSTANPSPYTVTQLVSCCVAVAAVFMCTSGIFWDTPWGIRETFYAQSLLNPKYIHLTAHCWLYHLMRRSAAPEESEMDLTNISFQFIRQGSRAIQFHLLRKRRIARDFSYWVWVWV